MTKKNPNIKYCPNCKTEYFSPGEHKCPVCETTLISDYSPILLREAEIEINVRKAQEDDKRIPVEVRGVTWK